MTQHDRRPGQDEALRSADVWPWLAVLALSLAVTACLSAAGFSVQRVDVFHAAYFDSCAVRAYQVHWQDGRAPASLVYGYGASQVSFVSLEIWIANGPTLRFSKTLPTVCPGTVGSSP
ncbi:MAG: hypothetical protein HY023_10690 [Chloroflexi bacterium]|nr:hypothetical protein [Chloroflexota bacterium]MBI3761729.1 hypothetical protein [Chloroflexota bacterium]